MSWAGARCHAGRDRGLFLRDCLPHEAISAAHQSVLQEDPASQRPLPSTIFPSTPFTPHELIQCDHTTTTTTADHWIRQKKPPPPPHLHPDAVAFNSIISMGERVPCTECTQTAEYIRAYQDNELFPCCAESTRRQCFCFCFCGFFLLVLYLDDFHR